MADVNPEGPSIPDQGSGQTSKEPSFIRVERPSQVNALQRLLNKLRSIGRRTPEPQPEAPQP
ncbi:MAG: hypothetical protein AAB512_05440 [Patescibacteria group bacterium]